MKITSLSECLACLTTYKEAAGSILSNSNILKMDEVSLVRATRLRSSFSD